MELIEFNSSNIQLFSQYRELKYSIFCREFNWQIVSKDKNMADIDQYDKNSVFFCVLNDQNLIGFCRCTYGINDYPYRNLLGSYIKNNSILEGDFCVLTAFAFKEHYRGLIHFDDWDKQVETIAHNLFFFVVKKLMEKRISKIFLSAGVNGSEKVFRSWGFSEISSPLKLEGAPVIVRNFIYRIC